MNSFAQPTPGRNSAGQGLLRFCAFEMNLQTRELRKSGMLLAISPLPFKLLALLASRRGEVVTREEIQAALWPDGTHVDFERGINTCIRQIRAVLNDDAATPRFIETLSRHGYRFITPTEFSDAGVKPLAAAPILRPESAAAARAPEKRARRVWVVMGLAVIAMVALLDTRIYRNRFKTIRAQPQSAISIAVLPLRNLTGNPSKAYLADGISEEMITGLARVEDGKLRVIGSASGVSPNGGRQTIEQIADELHVQYVIEGSVQSERNHVRVTTQLIRASNGVPVWADSYDGDTRQILGFENNVTKSVTQALALKLPAGRLPEHIPATAEAHDAYLRGLYDLSQRSKTGFEDALESFGTAVAQDPNYSRAYAELAVSYDLMGQYDWINESQAHSLGEAAAMQAIAENPSLAEAHAALGFAKWFYDWNPPAAEKELAAAIHLNPDNVDAHHWYAMALMTSGRIADAEKQMREAIALDPQAAILRTNLGWVHYMGRQYALAIQEMQEVIKRNPNFLTAHYKLWWMYSRAREQAHAWEELQKITDMTSSPENQKRIAESYQRGGYPAALKAFATMPDQNYSGSFVDAARSMIFAGNKAEAVSFLERAYRRHEGWMVFIPTDPTFDPLRAYPKFARLVRQVGSSSSRNF